MEAVSLDHVSKTYSLRGKQVEALSDFSLTIDEGEIVGLVGPNGAGKSTMVKLICGILTPTSGTVRTLGYTPSRERVRLASSMGVMFGQRSSLWYNIPVEESMLLMRDIYAIPKELYIDRLDEYSHMLGVEDLLSVPVRKLSLGQRMRCELLATILHHPRLLILDEPTVGLDVAAKAAFREILHRLSANLSTTVVLCTHDLQDVERVCHRVILLNHGRKELDLEMASLLRSAEQYVTLEIQAVPGAEGLRASPYFRTSNQEWMAFYLPRTSMSGFIQSAIDSIGASVKFRSSEPSLEDILYAYYHEAH